MATRRVNVAQASGSGAPRSCSGRGPGMRRSASAIAQVVDARLAAAHVSLGVELPLLVAVAAPPLAARIAALVLEANGDPVVRERPEVLPERIVQLAVPLAAEELDDRRTAGQELVAIAPLRVLGVGAGHPLRIAGVPRVLRRLHLLAGGLLGERWRRWSHAITSRVVSTRRQASHPVDSPRDVEGARAFSAPLVPLGPGLVGEDAREGAGARRGRAGDRPRGRGRGRA